MLMPPMPVGLTLALARTSPFYVMNVPVLPVPMPSAIFICVPFVVIPVLFVVVAMVMVLRDQISRRKKCNAQRQC